MIRLGITAKETWGALIDMGYYLPAFESSICKKMSWLLAVCDGRICCPGQDSVKVRICRASPLPTKLYLISEYKRIVRLMVPPG